MAYDEFEALGRALAAAQGLRGPAAECAAKSFAVGRDGSESAAREAWEAAGQGSADLSAAVDQAVATETSVLGVSEAAARAHVQGLVRAREASLGTGRTATFVAEYARRLAGGR